nr:MAG TPA: hypothetical protein [Caudoviricetes sp.]
MSSIIFNIKRGQFFLIEGRLFEYEMWIFLAVYDKIFLT